MNSELIAVLDYLENDRGVKKEIIISLIEESLVVAARKSIGPANELRVKIDPKSGDMKAFAQLKVVEEVISREKELAFEDAELVYPDVKMGDMLEWEVTPKDFGRIAAQTAKQAIALRLKQAEKLTACQEFEDHVGSLVSGIIRDRNRGDIVLEVGRTDALLPYKECVPNEDYNVGDMITVFLKEITAEKSSHSLLVSRRNPSLVVKLFEREVSEISEGYIEVMGIAREPGYRSKIAVKSNDSSIDPVGACVGMRGSRVKNIVRELNGEKVDIVVWNDDIVKYVTNALQPAELKKLEVDADRRTIHILTSEDQFSLAIGKKGQNARLASRLTGWKIDINKESKKTEEMTFQEQVDKAVKKLTEISTVDKDLALKLVTAGFLSVAGIVAADIGDISDIEGIDKELAEQIISDAKKLT